MSDCRKEAAAEGEFNRFYIRALSLHSIESDVPDLLVYRAKHVESPRRESQMRIGSLLPAIALLNDLRLNTSVDTALGVPAGPNSGLSVKIP